MAQRRAQINPSRKRCRIRWMGSTVERQVFPSQVMEMAQAKMQKRAKSRLPPRSSWNHRFTQYCLRGREQGRSGTQEPTPHLGGQLHRSRSISPSGATYSWMLDGPDPYAGSWGRERPTSQPSRVRGRQGRSQHHWLQKPQELPYPKSQHQWPEKTPHHLPQVLPNERPHQVAQTVTRTSSSRRRKRYCAIVPAL